MFKFGRKKKHTTNESTKEAVDNTIEELCEWIKDADISIDEYFNGIRALANLVEARAQIKD